MKKRNEIFCAILLKKESLIQVNGYKIKGVSFVFALTNVLFPFVINLLYLAIKKSMTFENMFDIFYFVLWNIIINIVLCLSLWLIFFISNKLKIELFVKAVIFMNLVQPLEVLLSYTIDSFIITLFFLLYDFIFLLSYIANNIKIEIAKERIVLYISAAFLMVFVFLCIVGNDYMLFSERIF